MASKPSIRRVSSDSSDKVCTVCYHTPELWAVSPCDHAMCLKCATRLRVLCKSKECPVCRETNDKVAVVEKCRPFSSVLSHRAAVTKKIGFVFDKPSLQKHFEALLTIYCQKCGPDQQFHNMRSLKDHLRKEHDLFMCEMCLTHLKLFPHEHKLYTQSQMDRHRREGDPNDSSHKGHPLCQFCHEHFFDSDALFFHLKNRHFWCHFCEADGKQDYYANYSELRGHFKGSHYLCSEGECRYEKFTSVFRTKLDLQAHKAKFHSKGLSKSEVKQLRSVDVGFVYNTENGGSRRSRRRYDEQKEIDDFETAKITAISQHNKDDIPNNTNNIPDPPHSKNEKHNDSFPELSVVQSAPTATIAATMRNNKHVLSLLASTINSTASTSTINSKPTNKQCSEWPSLGIDSTISKKTVTKCSTSTVNPPPGFSVSMKDKVLSHQQQHRGLVGVDHRISETQIFEMAREILDYNKSKINQFRNWSSSYQRGEISVYQYYDHCANLFGSAWDSFGIKLARTLPDTSKCHELYNLCKNRLAGPPPGFHTAKSKSGSPWEATIPAVTTYKKEEDFPSLHVASTMPDPITTPTPWSVKLAVK